MKFVLFLAFTLVTANGFSATEDEAFNWYSSLNNLPPSKKFLKEVERERLFRNARFHKVAALEKLSKYDPSGQIGFCFGRAMTVHLLARKMGLEDASVRKLFIIGDLRQGSEPEWRFHVTTLVKGEDGAWWAVDPIMQPPLAWGGSMKMEEWMRTVQSTWDKKKAAHFYLVDNSTIIPDLRNVPDPDKETGEKLIEVAFDPKKQSAGFSEKSIEEFKYSEVDLKSQHRFFTNSFEEGKEDRFQYLGININGQNYDYLNYFVDLLTELKKDSEERHDLGEIEIRNVPIQLYSPRVEGWFRN